MKRGVAATAVGLAGAAAGSDAAAGGRSPKRRRPSARAKPVELADAVAGLPGARLARSWYEGDDPVDLARAMLGMVLVSEAGGARTSGVIVETEAYPGPHDQACHAHLGRRTARTESMFKAGGFSYVYTCRGTNHLLNLVTGQEGFPSAILIRAVEPLEGTEAMLERRGHEKVVKSRLAAGPGMMTVCLGITTALDRLDTTGAAAPFWVEDRGFRLDADGAILCSPRVGIPYAGEDIDKPWRFRVKDSPWTSRAK